MNRYSSHPTIRMFHSVSPLFLLQQIPDFEAETPFAYRLLPVIYRSCRYWNIDFHLTHPYKLINIFRGLFFHAKLNDLS